MVNLIKVINLDRRTDRFVNFMNQIMKSNLSNCKIERFSAIDGSNLINDIKNKHLENDPIFDSLKKINLSVPNGEFGCLLSHYFVLKEIENNADLKEDELVLIFEDDVFFTDYNDSVFYEYIDTQKLDFLFISGRWKKHFIPQPQSMKFFERLNKHIFKRINGHGYDWDRCAPAYMCTKKGARLMCERIINQFNSGEWKAIDNIYSLSTLEINTYDFFPHIYYALPNYETDIQGENLKKKSFPHKITF